jgi:phosphoserine aminotransferase
MTKMTKRVWNFSAGPAVLPLSVLQEAQRDLLALPGVGMSVLEISHRSKWFDAIREEAEANLRQLLRIPDHYRVLFLQGGASLQFAMVPMNLLGGGSADYIITGSWGEKAFQEAVKVGKARIAWSGKSENFTRTPQPNELDIDPNAAYVHFTSNETIQGVEFQQEPPVGDRPLVCDASSDFLSRPIPIERYALLYAGAQKNRRSSRSHDCDYPRGHAGAHPAQYARYARLSPAGRASIGLQHATRVRHLHRDAGHTLAAA